MPEIYLRLRLPRYYGARYVRYLKVQAVKGLRRNIARANGGLGLGGAMSETSIGEPSRKPLDRCFRLPLYGIYDPGMLSPGRVSNGTQETMNVGDREKSMRTTKTWVAAFAALALLLTACGNAAPEADTDNAVAEDAGDTATGADGDQEVVTVADDGERSVIRFAFAPDPVWDYLNDNGEIVAWEEENNARIVTSSTWDEFTYFAGGHGDIVSIGTQEIPVLEGETGIKTVTFGKYNFQRSPMMTRADSGYNTLEDVPKGSTICVSSPVSNTTFWTVAMNVLHGIDYRVGGGDYELIVNDHFVNPEALARGDCEAAVIIPEAAAPLLRTGELELMYDGQMPFQLYGTFPGVETDEPHVMSNLFSATEEYFDGHQEEVQAFLALWERGIELWQENKPEIVETYPQHFSVEDPEDVNFIVDFMEGENDWFVDSVYLDQEWIDEEVKIYEFMTDLNEENPNKLPDDFPDPRFEVIEAS